ncbi:MAG: 3-dehydroquinate synthase [Rubrobacter sp.]|jgi:3-dehydroquinate synthase|nr:3-dehydroquinate synthase [Rubrobacter sp.]
MPFETVEVPVAVPYPVVVGAGLDIGGISSEVLQPGSCAIFTDSTVGPLHTARVRDVLETAGWRVCGTIEVPSGETSKSVGTYADAVGRLARMGLTRDGTIFALGGGVVGDLGGFVAGTYMRGIDLVMLPTSLLAMVDSAVGGKVGVDLPEGKNLIGSFVRPRLVVADLDWLATLPARELSNGLAEAIKMGLLSGGDFFDDLDLIGAARTNKLDALQTLILRSIRFKARIVAEDEMEGGLRAILNYGHTIGHALEAAAGYNLPHGSAVAVGMLAASTLSLNRFDTDLTGTHKDLVEAAGLPGRVPRIDPELALAAMRRDKKRTASDGAVEHKFVLLRDIGEPVPNVPVGEDEARAAMGAILD